VFDVSVCPDVHRQASARKRFRSWYFPDTNVMGERRERYSEFFCSLCTRITIHSHRDYEIGLGMSSKIRAGSQTLTRGKITIVEDVKKLAPGIVYSSGMFIKNDSELATLSICYEKVYLPHLSDHDLLLRIEEIDNVVTEEEYWNIVSRAAIGWNAKFDPLAAEGVLARLDPPEPHPLPPQRPSRAALSEYGGQLIRAMVQARNEVKAKGDPILYAELMYVIQFAYHLFRRDITLPQIFGAIGGPQRQHFVALEAFATFKYLLPKINALESDEILELRRKLKDTREGFTMHLQKLSKGLDGMATAGEKLEDLKGYARNIVEAELIPDYREFRRQLEAEQAGKLKKLLDVTGKIMEIDAAPWTPRFWGLLLKALGMSAIEAAADQKERLTNRHQAYELMRTVEDSGR
jgi:hypothetical protein